MQSHIYKDLRDKRIIKTNKTTAWKLGFGVSILVVLIADFYNAFTYWRISVIHLMSIIPLYRNLSIYSQYKSIEWVLYNRKIVLKLVKQESL